MLVMGIVGANEIRGQGSGPGGNIVCSGARLGKLGHAHAGVAGIFV